MKPSTNGFHRSHPRRTGLPWLVRGCEACCGSGGTVTLLLHSAGKPTPRQIRRAFRRMRGRACCELVDVEMIELLDGMLLSEEAHG